MESLRFLFVLGSLFRRPGPRLWKAVAFSVVSHYVVGMPVRKGNLQKKTERPSAYDLRVVFRQYRTIDEVAASYSVSPRTVKRWLAAYKIEEISIPLLPPGRKTRGANERAIARKAIAAGKSVAEAADAAGVSKRTVERWRLAEGWEP